MGVEVVSGGAAVEAVAPAPAKVEVEAGAAAVAKNMSFREESNRLGDLKDHERKALAELRAKVEEAIVEGKLFDDDSTSVKVKVEAKKKEGKKKKKKAEEKKAEEAVAEEKEEEEAKKEVEAGEEKKEEEAKAEVAEAAEEKKEDAVAAEEKQEEAAEEKKEPEAEAAAEKEAAVEGEKAAAVVVVDKDVALWGVPLLPSKGDEATDVVLLKFLRARDFKVGAAFEMLRRTLRWRREWKSLAATAADGDDEEDALPEGACRLDGADREGHPVCYNALGVFADEAVYKSALGTDGGKKARPPISQMAAVGTTSSLRLNRRRPLHQPRPLPIWLQSPLTTIPLPKNLPSGSPTSSRISWKRRAAWAPDAPTPCPRNPRPELASSLVWEEQNTVRF